ncbi:hypothetical protein ACWGKW_07760 [Streptomyces sp. NPDC054766]|uniref:hypothetical protein n=1 Tax=Streptomyces rhizosphaerihabitans TaxID=1266770 RepID=UPI0021C1A3E9|nr:hypothetical protein [Streptomyces rhizosphaerihabitans]MCT9005044.1 hypothetical protein [Streptomyces rhizosphaerihabitans]
MDYAEPPPEEVAAMVVTDVRLPAEETGEDQWRELLFRTAHPEIGKKLDIRAGTDLPEVS